MNEVGETNSTMPAIAVRRRWPLVIALALGLAATLTVTGLWWFHARRSADPLDLGLMAYARGDYETALNLAARGSRGLPMTAPRCGCWPGRRFIWVVILRPCRFSSGSGTAR